MSAKETIECRDCNNANYSQDGKIWCWRFVEKPEHTPCPSHPRLADYFADKREFNVTAEIIENAIQRVLAESQRKQ